MNKINRAFLLVMLSCITIQAKIISVNINAANDDANMISEGESFGILSLSSVVKNWNNLDNSSSNLVWSDGSISSVGMLADGKGGPVSWDQKYANTPLSGGYAATIDTSGNPRSITLTNLNENFKNGYYIIAYVGGYNITTNAYIGINSTWYYYSVFSDPSSLKEFIQTKDSDSYDGSDIGQYAVFGSSVKPLLDDAITIVSGALDNRAGIGGFQIVEASASAGLHIRLAGRKRADESHVIYHESSSAIDETKLLASDLTSVSSEGVLGLDENESKVPDGDDPNEANDTTLTIEPDDPFNWITDPDGSIVLTVGASEKMTTNQYERVVLMVWDWKDRPVRRAVFDVPFTYKIRFLITGQGVYRITLDRQIGRAGFAVNAERDTLSRKVRSIGAVPQNRALCRQWNYDEFMLGVSAFPARLNWTNSNTGENAPTGLRSREGYWKAINLEANLAARCGFGSVRIGWEMAPYLTNVCDVLNLYSQLSMQIFLKLKQDPQASLLPRYQVQLDAGTLYGNSENYPKVQSDNALWFKEIFQQTAGLVGYYEILNEPDLYGTKTTGFWKGTPQEYVDLSSYVLDLHETYASNSLISQGGMTHYKDDNEDDPLLVPEVITRSLQNRLSLYAYHCHGPIENLISEKGNVRNVLTRSGFDPASVSQYNSESGLMTGRLSREILQAIALPKKILYGWAHGDCGMLVYDLRDKQGTRLNETSSDWGLTCHYFCPKPGYGTVASLVSILAGAHFEQSVYEDSLFQLYRFLRDGDTVLTLMDLERPIDGGHAITLNFDRIPYETVELIDEMGNITIIDPSAVASVNVGDFVNYIRFPGIVFSQDSVSVTKEGATDYRLRVIN